MTDDYTFAANTWDDGAYRFWIGRALEFPNRSERKLRLLAACSRHWADVTASAY